MDNKFIKIISLIVIILVSLFVGLFFVWELFFDFYVTQNLISIKHVEPISNFTSLPLAQDKVSKFLFFGDLMLDRNVGKVIQENSLDYLFKGLAGEENRFFQGIDLISANLEGAVTDSGAHYTPQNIYDFAFKPELIKELGDKYNFNFFNLANNHLSDQGERGIIETKENLNKLNFNYSGCQDREVGECSSEIAEINGQKIGLAGFSMVYGHFDLEKAKSVIQNLQASSSEVIVNIHWGVEYDHYFNQTQKKIAHELIDAGADIIIGHHPHVIQGMEIYNSKPIFYSLGNFIFDQYFSRDTQEGLAVGINIYPDRKDFYLFPLVSNESKPSLARGEEKKRILEQIISWSNLSEEFVKQTAEGKVIILDY